jgi:hypothetical protein
MRRELENAERSRLVIGRGDDEQLGVGKEGRRSPRVSEPLVVLLAGERQDGRPNVREELVVEARLTIGLSQGATSARGSLPTMTARTAGSTGRWSRLLHCWRNESIPSVSIVSTKPG